MSGVIEAIDTSGEHSERVHGLQVVSVIVVGSRVRVVLSCEPHLPFGYLLPTHVSRIQAVATAKQLIS